MSSEFETTLRRIKPDKLRRPLLPRPASELEFLGHTNFRPVKFLYDTTVYIDILQNRFPLDGERWLRAVEGWHSPVTEAELAAACGLLDPGHPGTKRILTEITQVIERRSAYRTISPDREIWRESGVLSGVLSRLLGYGKDQRRRVLNDALVFTSARKHGCTVLTRNINDFDFLQQLDPSVRVLFYK